MRKTKFQASLGWNLELMFDEKLRPTIFNSVTGLPGKRGCTSYVYKITNKLNGKIYIGYHRESDDVYRTSSKNKEFQELLASGQVGILDMEIIFWGSVQECKQEEYELLSSDNAATNPLYYNLNNGQPGVRKINLDITNKLTDEIDDIRKHQSLKTHTILNEETCVLEFSLKDLCSIERLQSRELQIDIPNLRKIIDRIKLQKGNYDMPVLVENITIDGTFYDYLLISGNHTRRAYKDTAHLNVGHTLDTLFKCVVITEEVCIKLNLQESEIWILSNNLNADYNIGKSFSVEDGVKECLEFHKMGHSWETLEMRDRLVGLGLTTNQVGTVFNKVHDALVKEQWLKDDNMIYDYIVSNRDILDDKVKEFQNQGYFVIDSTSGNPHLYRWMDKYIMHQLKRITKKLPLQERVKIVVHHTNIKSRDEWRGLWEKLIRPQHMPTAMDGHRFTIDELNSIREIVKYPDFSYYELPMMGPSLSKKEVVEEETDVLVA